jgi:outer membrane protein assembly factor BamA
MLRAFLLFTVAALAAPAQKSFPLLKIQVEGNQRFTTEAIIQASQLKPGVEVTVDDFTAACRRLSDTGLFSATRFRYQPAENAGFDLTLIVEEEQDLREVRIEIPEIDEAAVWSWLDQNEPLVKKQMPANDPATAYYIHAIERFLAGQGRTDTLAARMRTDPASGAVITLFRPAELPKIASVRFEGAQAVAAAALEKALAQVAIGAEYTEPALRELIDFNVRRLFEDQGRLGVQFPRIRLAKDAAGGVTITISVEEGPVYHVGAIDIAGDHLPNERLQQSVDLKAGDIASGQRLTLIAAKIRAALGRDGYLDAATDIERRIDPARAVADFTVVVQKGPQSKCGALRLEGLDDVSAARARAWWKLAPGAVLNTERVDEFEATLMRDSQIRFRRISRRYEPASAGAVDVVFTFR